MANGKTILVVDDDPGSRHLLQFVLGKSGCEIKTAGAGAQAIAIASAQKIDLLVTDLMMQGMDGFQLAQSLREMPAYTELPVIMLSARWQVEFHDEVWKNDPNAVMMSKPFSPIELTSRIKLLLHL